MTEREATILLTSFGSVNIGTADRLCFHISEATKRAEACSHGVRIGWACGHVDIPLI